MGMSTDIDEERRSVDPGRMAGARGGRRSRTGRWTSIALDVRGRRERSIQRAERLLAGHHEELRKADSKASQCLGAAGAMGVAVVSIVTGGTWSPHTLARMGWWLWWASCTLWTVGVVLLALTLMPRLDGDPDRRQLAFFGHVHALSTADLTGVLEGDDHAVMPGLVSELRWTSRVIVLKYRLVRVSVFCLAAAIVTMVGTAVL